MRIKNKIIVGLAAMLLVVGIGIAPKTANAATADWSAVIAQLNQLVSQIATIAAAQGGNSAVTMGLQSIVSQITQIAGQVPSFLTQSEAGEEDEANKVILSGAVNYSNGQTVTYSDPGYANPSSCPAPANAGCSDSGNSSVVAVWAKNPANGDCCQYSPSCQAPNVSGWSGFSSKETCQAAKNACVISSNACVQNGKSYPLVNTCKSGYTPYIDSCSNYGTYCEPEVRCRYAGGATLGKTCKEACAGLGISITKWDSAVCVWDGPSGIGEVYSKQNIIGPTADCSAMGAYSCSCNLDVAKYIGADPSRPAYLWNADYLGDNECEAVCHDKGYTWAKCQLNVADTAFTCNGYGNNVFAGETNTCKSGANYKAGCCCFNVGGVTGGANPAPAVSAKANGQQCAANTECSSGNCSYTYCAPAGSCGGVKDPMFFANGASASNQWLDGVCRNGVWKTVNNGIGCNSFACDSGTCTNNKCVASGAAGSNGSKANGQQCASGGDCVSGNCSYTYCAPVGGCGGVKNPMYFANGASASNQWFGGVCRNGVWKVSKGNIGCGGDLSFPCDSGSCVNNKCQ